MFGPVDVAHSEKFPINETHLKKRNCWTLDLWLLIVPFAGVTPLAPLLNLARPQRFCRTGLLLSNTRCPKPIQIAGPGTGTRFFYSPLSQTAY
jgi:hypothetical protein